MLERADELCTSTLTLGEVLVKPGEQGNQTLRQRYEDVLSQTTRLIAFDREAARRYAEIRRNRCIRPPDAIPLACRPQRSNGFPVPRWCDRCALPVNT